MKKLFLPLLFLAAVVLCAGCGASREQLPLSGKVFVVTGAVYHFANRDDI